MSKVFLVIKTDTPEYTLSQDDGGRSLSLLWQQGFSAPATAATTAVSKTLGNIITLTPDGIYANVDTPVDISSYITALDTALI